MVKLGRTEDVLRLLEDVCDPEIPAVSVIDLGIVDRVTVMDSKVEVVCLPTFVGCPALDVIKEDIEERLTLEGFEPTVRFVFQPPWTSERITEQGRKKLAEYGLAPPAGSRTVKLTLLAAGPCPYCGSSNTSMESPFGPTLCRATCYCRACRNPFEQFKPV